MTPFQELLATSGLDRTDARLLLQHVSGLSHAQLIARSTDEAPESVAAAFWELVKRRQTGEPVAYLVGKKAFYGRDFLVSPATLIPRPETELLVDMVLARLKNAGSVWDIGTGSGAIAVTLAAENVMFEVVASDVSAAALEVARENARRCAARVQFLQGSWFDVAWDGMKEARLPAGRVGNVEVVDSVVTPRFDVIVSNPPYIAQGDAHLQRGDLRFEPQQALSDFADGLSAYRVLAAYAARYLKPGGYLMVEHGFDQAAAIKNFFHAANLKNIEQFQDYNHLPRITIAKNLS